MSTEEENSLRDRAKLEIDMCCQTLCERQVVQDYIEQLERKVYILTEQNKILKKRSNTHKEDL